MNKRTTVLIFFLWALITVITPTLIRMSASAKLLDGLQARGMKSRLPRRALIHTIFVDSPASEPAQGPGPGPAPGLIWRSKYGLCGMCSCSEGLCWCCMQ